MYKSTFIALSILSLTGCASLAPDYFRPEAPVTKTWPQGESYKVDVAGANVKDTPWDKFILDEKLKKLIALGLENNRDIRKTLANIESSQALYRVQKAALLPTITGTLTGTKSKTVNTFGGSGTLEVENYSLTVGMSSYEIDLFGRIRSLTDAALKTYLATEDAHRIATISLISNLASAYQVMAADQSQLELATQTMNSAKASMDLISKRMEKGVATKLEVRQAETVYQTARANVASYTTAIAQDKNALDLLAGTTVPDALLPNGLPSENIWFAEVGPGLDSTVLLNRPDVSQAEHQLISANANIGAARAAFFPTVRLTATTGLASAELSSLLSSPGAWSLVPSISVPIFNAGTNKANLKYAEAQQKLYLANYELVLQTAFKDVANALARKGTIKEQLDAQRKLVEAAADSYKIANERYKKGVSTYLNALDAQRTLYTSQSTLIAVQQLEYDNFRTLYNALGGGVN